MTNPPTGLDLDFATLTPQQQREWRQFTAFCLDFKLQGGNVCPSDRPDVRWRANRLVGIEITALYISGGGKGAESEQAQRPMREAVVKRAQAAHIKAGGRPIDLHIGFDPAQPLTAQNVAHVAANLAEIASHVQRGKTGQIADALFEHVPALQWMYMAGEFESPKWHVTQSYSVPLLLVDRVEQVIAEKIEKAKKYEPCDAYWLLMTVDFWNPAQDQDITWPQGATVECGPFERVFLYEAMFRRVVEVPRAQ